MRSHDGADILFALPGSRRKTGNLRRDPRATVVVFDAANPYESAQVQGTASLAGDPDGTLIDELSHKYTGGPYPASPAPTRRQGHHQLAQPAIRLTTTLPVRRRLAVRAASAVSSA